MSKGHRTARRNSRHFFFAFCWKLCLRWIWRTFNLNRSYMSWLWTWSASTRGIGYSRDEGTCDRSKGPICDSTDVDTSLFFTTCINQVCSYCLLYALHVCPLQFFCRATFLGKATIIPHHSWCKSFLTRLPSPIQKYLLNHMGQLKRRVFFFFSSLKIVVKMNIT